MELSPCCDAQILFIKGKRRCAQCARIIVDSEELVMAREKRFYELCGKIYSKSMLKPIKSFICLKCRKSQTTTSSDRVCPACHRSNQKIRIRLN